MKTILITGGSGLVGRALSDKLIAKGYSVIWLSRERFVKAAIPRYKWDYQKNEIDEEALQKADIIVHLAGVNLMQESWTRVVKQQIVESRILTARLLFNRIKKSDKKPEAFISASAIGIYGNGIEDVIFEEDTPVKKHDFLRRTCLKWEAEARRFTDELGIPSVMIRKGVVLSHRSESFQKMALPTRMNLGAPLGSGKQFMSWIHIDDLCEIYIKAIEDTSMVGPYNAVAPQFTTNADFMRTFARVMRKAFIAPRVPSFFMRLFLGEAADMILGGSRVSSQKIKDAGFEFAFPTAVSALQDCLAKMKESESKQKNHAKK